MGGRRLLLGLVVAALTGSALLAVGILLFGDFGETEGKILGTTAMLAGYGLLALPAGFLLDQRRAVALGWAVLGLAVVGFALGAAVVWANGGDTLGKALLTATVLGFAATQTGALVAARRPPGRLFALSVALVLAVAAMAIAAAWGEIDSGLYYRLLGAIAVLDILAVALQPILAAGRGDRREFRLRVTLAGGGDLAVTVDAPDFASAAAKAIRQVERDGRQAVAVASE